MSVQPPGQDSSYLDFGMSFGSNIWSFIDYPPPAYSGTLNETKMNTYLSALFYQMEGAGQNTVYLSFAQLDNIDAYQSGNFSGPGVDASYDVITALLSSMQTNNVSVPGYPNFLSYLVDKAHQNGMKVGLAFGGGVATDSTFKILQKVGETYQGQASKLASFIEAYGIDDVDFDIEDATALSSQQTDPSGGTYLDFFQALHAQLEPQGKSATLTTMLGTSWRSTLSTLLTNFNSCFDGVNLMAYSDTQYWLDPNVPAGDPDQGWTIEDWVNAIGKQNAGAIHVGFDDGVAYANPSANGGQCSFNIKPGSTNGQAAAQIYEQVLGQLKADGYGSLGQPFFWPAADVRPNGEDRYAPTSQGGANFVSSDMQDFYNWLSK